MIDLGYDRGPVVTPRRERRPAPRMRRLALAVAGLALVASARGSLPAPPGLIEEFAVPAEESVTSMVGGDAVFTVGIEDGAAVLTARAGGRIRWTVPVGVDGSAFAPTVAPGVVLVTGLAEGGVRGATVAFDAATGARLWIYPSSFSGWIVGDLVFMAQTIVPDGTTDPRVLPVEYAALDRHSGAQVWTARLPETQYGIWALDWGSRPNGEVTRMAGVSEDGRLTVRDLRTGRAVATRQVPAATADDRSLVLAAGLVLLTETDAGRTRIDAYDAATLASRWSVPELEINALTACGQVLCGHGPDSLLVIDPATGLARFGIPGGQFYGDLETGDLIVQDMSRRPPAPHVVSATTGLEILELRGWYPTGLVPGTPYAFVVRNQPGVQPRTLVALLDLDTGAEVFIGGVDGSQRCEIIGPLGRGLSGRAECRDQFGAMKVWRWGRLR